MPPKHWLPLDALTIVQPQTPQGVDNLAEDFNAVASLLPGFDPAWLEGMRDFPEQLTLICHDGKPVAYIEINDNSSFDHLGKDSLEFGGAVLPEYRDNGLTMQIAPLIIRQAFRRTGKRKMLAYVDHDNAEAQMAITALGFQRIEPRPDLPAPDKLIYKLTRSQALNVNKQEK